MKNIIAFFLIIVVMNSQDCDLIIVGSGLAGTSAAIESVAQGGQNEKICIFELEASYGGNSMKSSSGMNAALTPIQELNNVKDSYDLFGHDTIKSGKGLSSDRLVQKLVSESTSAWEFLTSLGVDLSSLTILGGHSLPRAHRPKNSPLGATIMNKLHEYIKLNLPQIQVYFNSEILSLLKEENRVIGVQLKDRQVFAHSVILATGGFANDRNENSLLKEFAPHLMNIPTTNGPFSQGQGMKMARQIGAELIQMDQIQIHPTGFVDPKDPFAKTKFLGPELLRGSGGILINSNGQRFCDELGYRDYVSQKIFQAAPQTENFPQSQVLVLLNEEAAKSFGPTLGFYIHKGFISMFENGLEVAKKYNLPVENLLKTIEEYNQFAELKNDPFGKKVFPVKFEFEKKFYAAYVTPSLHYSMGGIKINEYAQVLDNEDNIIKGLYAAGEVTGGVHGGNRLGGNSILDCVVYGRTAGQSAIQEVLQRKKKFVEL